MPANGGEGLVILLQLKSLGGNTTKDSQMCDGTLGQIERMAQGLISLSQGKRITQ